MSHRSMPLATSRINGDDRIVIEAVTPVGHPTFIRITWPDKPATIISPAQFPEVASTVATLFARAYIVLAAMKAGREL
jgi:hypothetical protein